MYNLLILKRYKTILSTGAFDAIFPKDLQNAEAFFEPSLTSMMEHIFGISQ